MTEASRKTEASWKDDELLVARDLVKSYRRPSGASGGEPLLKILDGADVEVKRGERVAIQGESGIGKTTILNILGGLDRPDSGQVTLGGREIPRSASERARWRRRNVGFIFQFHGLLAEFSALENVMLPALISGLGRPEASARAALLLDSLGLDERLEHQPDQLSGGEQQRVALARALATRPSLVLADEPTGNLDTSTGDRVLDYLVAMQKTERFALIVATHSDRLAGRCDRRLRIAAGKLVSP